MKQNKKGNAVVWLFALASLFILAVAYLSYTPAYNGIVNSIDTSNFTAAQTSTWQKLNTAWVWWPALMLLGIIVYAFINTLRTDTFGGFR